MSKDSGNLSDIWGMRSRGAKDSLRQKELVRKAVKKNGKEIINEYNIIKSDGTKKVKVPIKFLEQAKIKYGKMHNEQKTGQGVDTKPGSVYKINRNGKPQPSKPGEPGEEGEDFIYNAEVSIDELVDILIEELELPWMDPKNTSQIEVDNEEYTTKSKHGVLPNLDLKKTIIENLKRNAAKGDAQVKDIRQEDFRYRDDDIEQEYHSNAAVYLLLDRSGSMDNDKMRIAKTMFFWVVQFLKRRYKTVELVFIGHDADAKIVDENEFFSISSAGGTKCSSALKLAYENIQLKHPKDKYNIYLLNASDGDNFDIDNKICIEYYNKLLEHVKAISYMEIFSDADERMYTWAQRKYLYDLVKEEIHRTRFVPLRIKTKDEIFNSLKKFFNVDRKKV